MSVTKTDALQMLNSTTPETVAYYWTDGNAFTPARFWSYAFFDEAEGLRQQKLNKRGVIIKMPPFEPENEKPEGETSYMWRLYYWITRESKK